MDSERFSFTFCSIGVVRSTSGMAMKNAGGMSDISLDLLIVVVVVLGNEEPFSPMAVDEFELNNVVLERESITLLGVVEKLNKPPWFTVGLVLKSESADIVTPN